ncbi:MAG: hypothetical protein B6242_14285 [Anaerolineaceae bacterium 4572_78]|nr:MAG: hypothetical protein B6242_14285 [Anaerolineaceae bacterium 4572_78]
MFPNDFDTPSDTEIMLVVGNSGVGKSSLVQEIHTYVTKKHGYFVTGKFEPFQHDIPYSGITAAFTDLIHQILTEDESKIAKWRAALAEDLHPNGQVMIDVIPKLETIIGSQPAVQALSPIEMENRFHFVFQHFIHAFTHHSVSSSSGRQTGIPLVIFLDDLQWVDEASLKLITWIMTDHNINTLLLVGAYDDEKVDKNHPLITTIEELEKVGVNVNKIILNPLTLDDVATLVGDSFYCNQQTATPLLEWLMAKTEGNPFFINRFLHALYQEKLLTFDQASNKWKWDIAEQKPHLHSQILALIENRFKHLPTETQQALHAASCVANHFDLYILSAIRETSLYKTYQDLLPAIQSSMIIPISDIILTQNTPSQPLLLKGDGTGVGFPVILNYKFSHDYTRQAIHRIIADEQRKSIHLKIGDYYVGVDSQLGKSDILSTCNTHIFKIVHHFNIGHDLLIDKQEKIKLIKLNLQASHKAKRLTIYSFAQTYLRHALDSYQEDIWDEDYDIAFDLHKEYAEVKYLNGHYEQSQKSIETLLEKASTNLEKAELYNLLIVQHTLTHHYDKAIAVGQTALSLLGIDLPKSDFGLALQTELIKSQHKLRDRKIESLIDEPEISDPYQHVVIKILTNMVYVTDIAQHALFPVVVTKAVNFSLDYGSASELTYAYAMYGVQVNSMLHDYQVGYAFGKLAIALSEKFHNLADKCKILLVFGNALNHWIEPLKRVERIFEQAYQLGLQTGALQTVGNVHAFTALYSFYYGKSLADILMENPKLLQFSQTQDNPLATDILLGLQRTLQNLYGLPTEMFGVAAITTSDFDYITTAKANQSSTAIVLYEILKLEAHYLHGDFDSTLNCIISIHEKVATVGSLFPLAVCNFYHSLALTALYPTAEPQQQKEYWETLEENQRQLKIWADSCPQNFQHMVDLISAEIGRIADERLETVLNLYDQAINSARENEFIQHEALTNERAAMYWLDKEKTEFAQLYLQKAYYAYQMWGATRKVQLLTETYSHLLVKSQTPYSTRIQQPKVSEASRQSGLGRIDLSTVMRSAQLISSEIVLSRLLSRLMTVAIENSGAERGFLISDQDGEWIIEIIGVTDDDGFIVQTDAISDSAVTSDILPTSIINYAAQSQESVVLHDATSSGPFSQDRYIIAKQPKSILCVPLVNQNKLVGILYLENNLFADAFTTNRLEVLKVLSAQAAVAIENARLYDKMQGLNSSLTESEKRLTTIVETVPIPVLITRSEDGTILYANSQAASLIGDSLENMVGQKTPDFYKNAEDRRKILAQLSQEGFIHDYELQIKQADGKTLWIILSIQTIIFDDKPALFTALYDITQRKWAEDALREAKDNLEVRVIERTAELQEKLELIGALTKNFPDGVVFLFDENLRYLLIEGSDWQKIGIDKENAEGKTVWEVFSPDISKQLVPIYRATLAGRHIQRESTFSDRIYQINYVPIRNEHNKILMGMALMQNTTEQKKAEEALRESEEKYRLLIEYASDAISVYDYDGNILLLNNAAAQLWYGGKIEEAIGKKIWDVLPKKMADRRMTKVRHVIRTGQSDVREEQLTIGSKSRWVRSSKEPTRDSEGNIIGVLNMTTDITDRKKVELALRESEERWQLVVSANNDGIWDWNIETGDVFYSPNWKQMLGYEDHEITADFNEYVRLVHPKDIAKVKQAIQDHLDEKSLFYNCEFRMMHRDGTPRWIMARGQALWGIDDQPIRMVGSHQNITERKKLQGELQDHQDKLEARVADRTYRLQLIHRLSGEFINEKTNKLSIVAGSGVVGKRLKSQGRYINMGQGIIGTVAAQNKTFVSNNVNEILNYTRNPLLPNTNSELAVPLRKGDRVLGVMDIQSRQVDRFSSEDVDLMQSIADQAAICIDNVHLLKKMEITITQLQEMDRLKSQFLTVMSHELRTPLNAILGFADLLLLGISGDLSEPIRHDVQLIYNSGQHLLTIINDVLDISKIEAGMIELVQEELDVKDVMEDVEAASTLMVADIPVELITDIPDDVPTIYADRTRLKQILLNMVENAVKFTEKGRVTIQTRVCEDDSMMMRFSIIDTGIGIPADKLGSIFETFEQADMSNQRAYGGTGLGLTICQQLVQLHGGVIEVDSKENIGSTFSFTIPIHG